MYVLKPGENLISFSFWEHRFGNRFGNIFRGMQYELWLKLAGCIARVWIVVYEQS